VKRALEWSKILFRERKGIWATARQYMTLLPLTKTHYHIKKMSIMSPALFGLFGTFIP